MLVVELCHRLCKSFTRLYFTPAEMFVLHLPHRIDLLPVMIWQLEPSSIDNFRLLLLLLLKQIVLSPIHILLNYILPQITLLQLSILV